MKDLQDLELLVKIGTPIIAIQTIEEDRATNLVRRIANRIGKPLNQWSITQGLRLEGNSISDTQEPGKALARIGRQTEAGVYILFDIHTWLDDAVVLRTLRDLAKNQTHTLFLVGSTIELPKDLSAHSSVFELSLPSLEQLKEIIHEESASWGQKNQRRVQAQSSVIDSMTRILSGLTENDARRLVKRAIYDDGLLSENDIPEVMQTKYQLLDGESVLSYEFDHVDLSQVAGLRNLKHWLEMRKEVFLSSEGLEGLDPPKGLLLLGVQGGGKSLAAKSVAGSWKLPLLRLDFGTLYNKYYGETERNLREALHSAEAMAPCVLWMDEIEKGLGSDDDGGPSKRILGTLLTWMAEHKQKVFLVATANDIEALPPELMRKGRFDEIFFVDLPSQEVRQKIFEIHLSNRNQLETDFDTSKLASESDGFTGAEIEQAVVSALYNSHARKEKLSTEHVSQAISSTQPLSVVMKEKIQYLRQWAKERTVSAD